MYAVVGPTAGIVAYSVVGVWLQGSRRRSRDILLVDAEGGVSQEASLGTVGEPNDEFGSYPIADTEPGLRFLPYPDTDAQATRFIERSRGEFDAIVVVCGSSRHTAEWLSTADGVIVSSGGSRELAETFKRVERLGGTGRIILAPMGRLKLPNGSSGYPVFKLPSLRHAAFRQEERMGPFAALTDNEASKAFGGLLEELLAAAERPDPETQRDNFSRLRKEATTKPEDTSGTSHPSHRGATRDEESGRSSGRLSADEIVEKMRRGAQKSGDLDPDGPPEPESGPEPVRTRLEALKSSLAVLLDGRLGRGGSDRESDRDAGTDSVQELERRLKLSLRETAVDGVSRVGVGSPKGGVGKSSVAYALAGSVAYYTNLRVCLVDADPNFGSMRLLVPRPVEHSVVSLANAADEVQGLSDIRAHVAQNERMRLDIVLGPEQASDMARLDDLGEAYSRIDSVLSKFYDLVVYDLGLGFRDPAIRRVLSLSDELLFVTDSEVIPNAMLSDAIQYVEKLGVDLERTTLVLNHRLPASDESAQATQVRDAHTSVLRRVTEVPYDAWMSQLLNQRSFHIEDLSAPTRLGILTTVAACLEGLRNNRRSSDKVVVRNGD